MIAQDLTVVPAMLQADTLHKDGNVGKGRK